MDQVGHSSYYLHYLSPGFFPDIKIGSLIIDGTLNMPSGIYNIGTKKALSDTNLIRNYFKWKQGDFQYREISVGTHSSIVDSGRLKLLCFGRSFPGSNGLLGPNEINYKGNTLQNYMIEYKKDYRFGTFNSGIVYHKENSGLPINSSYKKRKSESFHFGVNFQTIISKIKLLIR